MKLRRNNPHNASHKNIRGHGMNLSICSTLSHNSVHTTSRHTPKDSPEGIAKENPDHANYKIYKDIQGAQLLLDKYRQLKKSDLRQNIVKQYMNGG